MKSQIELYSAKVPYKKIAGICSGYYCYYNKEKMKNNKQKQLYLKHVEELYAKGYRFIIKVTDPNNKSYIFDDNPSGLYETKDCVDWYNEYDGINHYTSDQAKKEAAYFQKNHPNWIVQIKEISFNKK